MGTAERICSRKNGYITVLRKLGADAAYRRETGETVLDGEKLLREAAAAGCEITGLLMDEARPLAEIPECGRLYVAPAELVGYASPVKNSPGPVFSLKLPELPVPEHPRHAVLLEDVQDPGNVGTVIRTANALGMDLVVLVGGCADRSSPRCVRATMGAAFRQCVVETNLAQLPGLLEALGLQLVGTALTESALDIRRARLDGCAVAVGNEGHGLSAELLGMCRQTVIIPMAPGSESLNAATAAAVAMWEIIRREG